MAERTTVLFGIVPIGLKVEFSLLDDICIGSFTPQMQHAGYDNLTHGGILFSLLDDDGELGLASGKKCFTAKADIRYRQELPIGTEVRWKDAVLNYGVVWHRWRE